MIRARLLPAAELELLREVAYYSRAHAGVGQRFLSAVEAAVEHATRRPRAGKPTYREARRLLVKGFPFSVVYCVQGDELLVVAIAAHRRQVGYWRARLDDPSP